MLRHRRELHAFWKNAQLLLFVKTLRSERFPSGVIAAEIFSDILFRGLLGIMRRIEGDVVKKRLTAIEGLIDKFHGPVDVGIRGIKILLKPVPLLAVQAKGVVPDKEVSCTG